MTNNLSARILKLESMRGRARRYVIRVSRPPTPEELAALAAAGRGGRYLAVMPHRCATVAEWLEQHASGRMLH